VAESTPHLLSDLLPRPDPRDPRASQLLQPSGASTESAWTLLGLPYDGGIPSRPGARFGPAALRRALAAFSTFDGDGATLPPMDDLGDLALAHPYGTQAHARIEAAAQRLFAAGRRAVFIGGDHGCTGSVIRGLAAARPELRLALVSIDSHLDVREYDDSTGLSSGTPFRRALETAIGAGERTAMIGIRPFANSEYYLDWARSQDIHLFSADAVATVGAASIAATALNEIGASADALYLSIDLDAADVAFAPGVSAPGIGGLTSREMIALVGTIAADPRLSGCDLMELSPPYDVEDRTARLGARLLLEILSRSR
jgi:formiminoglutamase